MQRPVDRSFGQMFVALREAEEGRQEALRNVLKWGTWSSVASLLLCAYLGYRLGGFPILVKDLPLFLSGRLSEIQSSETSLLPILGVMFATVSVGVPVAILAYLLVVALIGENKGQHALESPGFPYWGQTEVAGFRVLFLLCLLEELFTRQLFMGWFPLIPGLGSDAARWILALTGNLIWALIHLTNFKEAEDRHPLRVLPQFVSGLLFSAVFARYGLMVSVLAHFGYNAVLFARVKTQRQNWVDWVLVAANALIAVIAYSAMNRPLAEMSPWLQVSLPAQTQLAGWDTWDYFKASVFLNAIAGLVMGVLAYDRSNRQRKEQESSSVSTGCAAGVILVGAPITLMVLAAVVIGGYQLLLAVGVEPLWAVLLVSLYFAFSHKQASGSAIARTFWLSLPSMYLTVLTYTALGFGKACLVLGASALIGIPQVALDYIDD